MRHVHSMSRIPGKASWCPEPSWTFVPNICPDGGKDMGIGGLLAIVSSILAALGKDTVIPAPDVDC